MAAESTGGPAGEPAGLEQQARELVERTHAAYGEAIAAAMAALNAPDRPGCIEAERRYRRCWEQWLDGFGGLIALLTPAMHGVARRCTRDPQEADDAVHDVWLRLLEFGEKQPGRLAGLLHQALRKTDGGRAASVVGFFEYRAARRALDRLQARMRARAHQGELIELFASAGPAVHLDAEDAEVVLHAIQAVGRKDPDGCTVLLATTLGGMSVKRLAEDLGKPVGTLDARKSRFMARLREHLRREHPQVWETLTQRG